MPSARYRQRHPSARGRPLSLERLGSGPVAHSRVGAHRKDRTGAMAGRNRSPGLHRRLARTLRQDRPAMADGLLRRLFWRVTDALDYVLTLTSLRILDALAGVRPETPADQRRERGCPTCKLRYR